MRKLRAIVLATAFLTAACASVGVNAQPGTGSASAAGSRLVVAPNVQPVDAGAIVLGHQSGLESEGSTRGTIQAQPATTPRHTSQPPTMRQPPTVVTGRCDSFGSWPGPGKMRPMCAVALNP